MCDRQSAGLPIDSECNVYLKHCDCMYCMNSVLCIAIHASNIICKQYMSFAIHLFIHHICSLIHSIHTFIYDVTSCLQISFIVSHVSKCCVLLPHVSKCCMLLSHVSKFRILLSYVSKCRILLSHDFMCSILLSYVSKCCMFLNVEC